jgi:hypothetical protein
MLRTKPWWTLPKRTPACRVGARNTAVLRYAGACHTHTAHAGGALTANAERRLRKARIHQ